MKRKNRLKASSRGQTSLDMIFVVIILLGIGLLGLLVTPVIKDFATDFSDDPDLSTEGKKVFNDMEASNPTAWDNAFLFAVVMLWVSLIVSSFLIDTSPIFFIITIIMLLLVFIIGMIASNIYLETIADDELSQYQSRFPITYFVFNNGLVILMVMGFSAALSLYAKSRI